MANLGSLIVSFGADLKPLDAAVTRAETTFMRFQHKSTAVFSTIKRSVLSLQGAMLSLGVGLSVSKVIDMTKQYEAALVDMGKVTNQSFAQMNKQIQGMSSELGTSTELMRGYYQTISAGVTKPTKAIELLTTASKLAKVAHIDQATTVKTLAVIMGSYGKELKNTASAADLLLSIERYGITTTGEMATEIGSVANLAHEAGLSADELGASLAQLTKSGIGTAESVTELRSLLTALMRNFNKLPPAITKYGSALSAVKHLGFIGVLQEMIKSTHGNAQELTKLLGRQESYLALLQLTRNSGKEYIDVLSGMKNKTGALDKAWKEWKSSLEGVWSVLKDKATNILIKLGYSILPAIKAVLKDIVAALPTITHSFEDLWTILSALPKGVIQFFKDVNKQLIGIDNSANKAGKAIQNIKPPKPTFWQQFWKQSGILGTNIIHEFEFILKAAGEFLALLIKDVIDAVKFIGKQWTSLGKIMWNAITLHPKRSEQEWKKLLGGNAIETYKKILSNSTTFSNGIVSDWKDMVAKMNATTFPPPPPPPSNVDKTKEQWAEVSEMAKNIAATVRKGSALQGGNGTRLVQEASVTAKEQVNATKQAMDEIAKLEDSDLEYYKRKLNEHIEELRKHNVAGFILDKLYTDSINHYKEGKAKELEKTTQEVNDRIIELTKSPFEYFKQKLKEQLQSSREEGVSEVLLTKLKNAEIENYIKEHTIKMKKQTNELIKVGKSAAQALENSFSSIFFDGMQGKLKSLKSYFLSFASSIEKAVSEALAHIMVKFAIVKMFGTSTAGLLGFAKGGAFINGVQAFATGGLIDKPTIFPMANGDIGLAGEKGTEAIMPLARNNKGELGVKSNSQNVHLNIVNTIDPQLVGDYLSSPNGTNTILNVIQSHSYQIKKSLQLA